MKRLILLVFCSFVCSLAMATEPGRYQAIALPDHSQQRPGSGSTQVFILDSQEGHLWLWRENDTIYPPNGDTQLGNVLIYQGQIKPGQTMGEIIQQENRP